MKNMKQIGKCVTKNSCFIIMGTLFGCKLKKKNFLDFKQPEQIDFLEMILIILKDPRTLKTTLNLRQYIFLDCTNTDY